MKNSFFAMVFATLVLLFPVTGWANQDAADWCAEEIYAWVAAQMEETADEDLPPINFVSRSELRRLFETSNRQSYQSWTATYGTGRAQRMLDIYLKNLVGMFNPVSGVIYVGSFLSPCRQKAILAHELTHYIQTKHQNDRVFVSLKADEITMFREMEAYKIENRFMEQVCPDQMDPP